MMTSPYVMMYTSCNADALSATIKSILSNGNMQYGCYRFMHVCYIVQFYQNKIILQLYCGLHNNALYTDIYMTTP